MWHLHSGLKISDIAAYMAAGYLSDANLGRQPEFSGRAKVGPTFTTGFWQPGLN